RCLVCQNQSISGSNADLAKDLRSQVHSMLQAGKTEEEIKDYMVARYGDYVLYEPPMKPMTWVLWFGPAIIFLVGLFYVRRFIAQQNISEEPKKLSEQEAERLRDLQSEMNNKNEGDRS
ncbi:MAG: cytochrome c-type biogenesis protein CcmH, partial [Gammaproteobacteria bacterium]|nr:cytochrome c-type biogenesis protein CcmH [Gammaproteobacteria bacterium]